MYFVIGPTAGWKGFDIPEGVFLVFHGVGPGKDSLHVILLVGSLKAIIHKTSKVPLGTTEVCLFSKVLLRNTRSRPCKRRYGVGHVGQRIEHLGHLSGFIFRHRNHYADFLYMNTWIRLNGSAVLRLHVGHHRVWGRYVC